MFSSLAYTKLHATDKACEAHAGIQIKKFYEEAKYDGSRFVFPAFNIVGSTWVNLIATKAQDLTAESKRILEAMNAIDEDQLQEITDIVRKILHDDFYVNRLQLFAESIVRKASSYGLSLNVNERGLGVADGAYRAATLNSLRSARDHFSTELQLYISGRETKMKLSSLMRDTISILKKNGTRHEGVKASVQKDKIFISGSSLLIESGDLVQRNMSNGGQETFEVIDPGFHEAFHGIPAGYQMQVKNLGIPEAARAVQNITYNFEGHNARVNNHSVDNSTNVVSVNPEASEYIEALRSAIQEATISIEEKQAAAEVIEALSAQFQTERPSRPVISALLAALPHIASVASIASSLLALL